MIMSNDYRENIELNYNQILLKHIDRISDVSASMFGNFESGFTELPLSYVISQKNNALWHSSMMFRVLIPSSLRDEKFLEDTNNAIDEYNKQLEKLKKDGSTPEHAQNQLSYLKIQAAINLLDRRGLLFDKGGIAKFKGKLETKEVWE